ncbi:hypothetical protein GCM10023238_39020 [Streptomyces heliomycini]
MRQRLAAEAGDVEAMSVLGAMLLRRGDLDGAEPHLRAATAAGDRAAANNLGVLLHQRGYADEGAGWWRIAAVAGSTAAAHALGRHHRERGDEPAAEYWLRQSAAQGPHPRRVRPRRPAGAPRGHGRDRGVDEGSPPNGGTGKGRTGWPARWTAGPPGRATTPPRWCGEAEQWYGRPPRAGHRRAALHLGTNPGAARRPQGGRPAGT